MDSGYHSARIVTKFNIPKRSPLIMLKFEMKLMVVNPSVIVASTADLLGQQMHYYLSVLFIDRPVQFMHMYVYLTLFIPRELR